MISVDQIAQKEAEVDRVVLQARRESEGRVKAASGRCEAEDELEEALLELTVRKRKNEPHARQKLGPVNGRAGGTLWHPPVLAGTGRVAPLKPRCLRNSVLEKNRTSGGRQQHQSTNFRCKIQSLVFLAHESYTFLVAVCM